MEDPKKKPFFFLKKLFFITVVINSWKEIVEKGGLNSY